MTNLHITSTGLYTRKVQSMTRTVINTSGGLSKLLNQHISRNKCPGVLNFIYDPKAREILVTNDVQLRSTKFFAKDSDLTMQLIHTSGVQSYLRYYSHEGNVFKELMENAQESTLGRKFLGMQLKYVASDKVNPTKKYLVFGLDIIS